MQATGPGAAKAFGDPKRAGLGPEDPEYTENRVGRYEMPSILLRNSLLLSLN